jgi:hypothetical protein
MSLRTLPVPPTDATVAPETCTGAMHRRPKQFSAFVPRDGTNAENALSGLSPISANVPPGGKNAALEENVLYI